MVLLAVTVTSILIYVPDWLRQRDKWGCLAAVSPRKSFVKACEPGARGCLCRSVHSCEAPNMSDELGSEAPGPLRSPPRHRAAHLDVTLIKSRCFALLTAEHAGRCRAHMWVWLADRMLDITVVPPELWRLMPLISHRAAAPRRGRWGEGVDADEACWTMIKCLSLLDSGAAPLQGK